MSETPPSEPSGRFAIAERLPLTLHVAFWALLAAALANLVLNGRTLIGFDADTYIAQMHRIEATRGERPLSSSGVLAGLAFALVIAVLVTAAEVVLAVQVRRGRNGARTVATVLLAIGVILTIFKQSTGTGFLVLFFMDAVAFVIVWLLWLPPSNRYFRAVATARARLRPQPTIPATLAHPPAWIRDPSRRHQFRYWDGAHWTEHVADHGTGTVDPL